MQLRSKGRFIESAHTACVERAIDRFRKFCRFEPETGCVLWTGGTTQGRGHHVPYGSFWFNKRRWFAHRFSAKHIHGLDIEGFQVDHCCDTIPKPNTLCVQHVQAITAGQNRQLQDSRKLFIHLQVGLINYEDVFGPPVDELEDAIPYYSPPQWLGNPTGAFSDDGDYPF